MLTPLWWWHWAGRVPSWRHEGQRSNHSDIACWRQCGCHCARAFCDTMKTPYTTPHCLHIVQVECSGRYVTGTNSTHSTVGTRATTNFKKIPQNLLQSLHLSIIPGDWYDLHNSTTHLLYNRTLLNFLPP